jgi:alkylation response protein AidB-like acyl-CoA dehydrogenase
MDLMLSADQEAVRDAIREVLRDRASSALLRAAMESESGFDASLWQTAAELGWLGLAVPEASGGAGYGVAETMLLFVELGRSLAPGPWLGAVVAARALAGTDDAAVAEIVGGTRRVVPIDDPDGLLGTERLSGEAVQVLDAHLAGEAVVLGEREAWLVSLDGQGVTRTIERCMDPTRRLGRIRFADAPARRVAGGAGGLRRLAAVLAAAEAVGVAERTQEMSVDYAKVREQFGRPIGTFQAIKHRCADMAVRAEVARSAVTYAAVALDEAADDAPLHVHVAKALATDAAIQNATDNIQNHGGMGYTWESDAHLFLKRARMLEHVFGTRSAHLDAIAAPWRAAG